MDPKVFRLQNSSWHMQGRQYASWHPLMLILATTQSRRKYYWAASLYFPSVFLLGILMDLLILKRPQSTACLILFSSTLLTKSQTYSNESMSKGIPDASLRQFRVQESQGAAVTFLELPDYSLLCFAEAALSCEVLRHDIPSNVNQLLRT